ncbi:MAG: MFS transporter [bacterium]
MTSSPPARPPRSTGPGGGAPTGQGAGAPTEEEPPNPDRWKALAVCLVGGFMVLLDVSIVNVALKSISEGLHASGDQIQWVLSGYALTFGLLLVPGGRLGDVRGRRQIFIIGLVSFTAASALCGAAQNATWLVVARLVQGLAGGLLTPQISAVIQQMFRGRERGKAFGLFGSIIGISTALGPVVGGLLIQAFGQNEGWRWVFFVNLPIGIAAVPFALRLLPGAPDSQRRRHDYDPVGVVLLGAGVVVLLLPFVQEQQWKGSAKWLLVPLAVALLTAFIVWELRYERHGHEPLIDLELFGVRSYAFGSSMIAVYFAGFTPLFFVVTLLLQFGLGYSALMAGLVTLPFAISSGLAAAYAGRVVHRFGRPLVAIGLALVTAGYLGVLLVVRSAGADVNGWELVVPLIVGGLGSGLVISPNQTLTLSEVPVERSGSAGGVLQVGQRIGSAIGIAAVGSVFYAQLASSHGQYASAVQHGLYVAVAFLIAALMVAVVDVVVDRRISATAEADERPSASLPAGAHAG